MDRRNIVVHKATPNKFPVSRPPPVCVSCQHQKVHYFRISLIPNDVITLCLLGDSIMFSSVATNGGL